LNVLLVDDSPPKRRAVRKALLAAGFDDMVVEEAENGSDALAKLAHLQPDLILSDWRMPEMSGVDLLRELRARGDKVPFGFVTLGATEHMRETASRAGAQFLIESPLTAAHFRGVLEDYM
jgi:two-component system chemotaxis response regulator CheY